MDGKVGLVECVFVMDSVWKGAPGAGLVCR